ncbi:MAG TPA: hypothetical protein VFN88_02695, partial [Caulobacteraceae bacterium]|nr:hypothetical protein [Caulobacteraceae bacterium]
AWYLHRGGAWSALAWAAIALKTAGAAPLAAGAIRKNPKTLRACALAYALGAAPELAWLVGPMSVAALTVYIVAAIALGVAGYGALAWSPMQRRAPA